MLATFYESIVLNKLIGFKNSIIKIQRFCTGIFFEYETIKLSSVLNRKGVYQFFLNHKPSGKIYSLFIIFIAKACKL